jgi:hypothetical protein
MPSRAIALVFMIGVTVTTAVAWVLVDFSFWRATVFFLSMLAGGSICFVLRARD